MTTANTPRHAYWITIDPVKAQTIESNCESSNHRPGNSPEEIIEFVFDVGWDVLIGQAADYIREETWSRN